MGDLTKVLNHIEQSTMGTASEEDFGNLFEDLDLTSSKLGKSENDKNELIVKVLMHLDEIDFDLENTESDVLGDAYEYLIGQFASGAGKKAGEFYTPQQVSKNDYFSSNSFQFLIESLECLEKEIEKYGGKLHYYYGSNVSVLEQIKKMYSYEKVYSNQDFTPYALHLDEEMKK